MKVDVEFMDGEKRSYSCGGILSPQRALLESVSLLVMWEQNGEGAPLQHVATLPLHNIRQYHYA